MAPEATRTCISLAVAAALGAAGGALANPNGPRVVQGAATFSTNGTTLTIVPTAGAIIDWREFVIASDETTRFLQPSPSATVLNRIGGTAFGLFGRLESNARVLFLQSGRVFGDGIAIDLPGIHVAALRQTRPTRTGTREVNFPSAAAAARSVNPWVVMIVPGSVPVEAGALLPSGTSAEFIDARWPHLRAIITAPPGQTLDVAQLLRKSGALGIFGGMLAVPRGKSASGAGEPLQLANVAVPSAVEPPLPDVPAVTVGGVQLALRDQARPLARTPIAAVDDFVALGDDQAADAPQPISNLLAASDRENAAPGLAPGAAPPRVSILLATGYRDIATPGVASSAVMRQGSTQRAADDDPIVAPRVAVAESLPQRSAQRALGENEAAAPADASAESSPQETTLLATGEDKISAPRVAVAESLPPESAQRASGEMQVVAPVDTSAEVLPPLQTQFAMYEDEFAAPNITQTDVLKNPPVEPILLASVRTTSVRDVAAVDSPAAFIEAPAPDSSGLSLGALEPTPLQPDARMPAGLPEPVRVASPASDAGSSPRRVRLVTSDTPVWPAPAPVKLKRVERRMPAIMIGRRGGIFHL